MSIMKYSAINIGPIISTFDMVRKPRDIWAASYLFSKLMKCIVDLINETEGIDIFSPVVIADSNKKGVGLYPDRVYCKGEWNFSSKEILNKFAKSLGREGDESFKDYFNIMCATVDIAPDENGNFETKAIRELNDLLDGMELNTRAMSGKSPDAIWNFITNEDKRRKLYEDAFINEFGNVSFTLTDDGKKEKVIEAEGYGTLAEYASVQLSTIDSSKWTEARILAKLVDELKEKDHTFFSDTQEDMFFLKLKNSFPEDTIKSYHKYICVVQADGDNMGKTFSHKDLKDTETSEISKKLVDFGKKASGVIYEYGGLPIYAGGDDLLFLAPVVGKTKKCIKISDDKEVEINKCIFDLLKDIDVCFKPVKVCVEDKKLKTKDSNDKEIEISPSMSYGVSITYYKFPLYEALASARHLLFAVAKEKVDKDKKNAIAWCLQKNSGSSFSGFFSKTDILESFEKVILSSNVKDTIVSAVSHKIRENQALLQLWLDDSSYRLRNLNFFKKYMDYNEKDQYKKFVLELLDNLYEIYQPLIKEKDNNIDDDSKKGKIKLLPIDKAKGIFTMEQKIAYLKQSNRNDLYQMIYSMIRTAKFINGEEVKDE